MRKAAILLSLAFGLSASPVLARDHDDYRGRSYSDRAYREDQRHWEKERREREKAFRKAEKEREKQYRKMMRHPDRYGYGTYSPYGYAPNSRVYRDGYYDRYGRFHPYGY
jgi:hypothetical protein